MKFLVNSMLGKLARLLRIFGYDTVYAEEVEKSAPDSRLLEYAIENDRIIITRDLPFHKRAKDRTIYVEGFDAYENLLKLEKKLGLTLTFSLNKARCSTCNSVLKKIDDKTTIVNDINPNTFQDHDEFYQCLNTRCNKIYWEGTHIEKIVKKLNEKA